MNKIEGTNFIFVNISNYDYLNNYLKNHRDIIYKKHGGTADSTNYWNNRWSLWFRKVASLKYALDHFQNYEFLVWIDCDCFFKKHLSTKIFKKRFNKKDCFYYLGEYRKNSKWELAACDETIFMKVPCIDIQSDLRNYHRNSYLLDDKVYLRIPHSVWRTMSFEDFKVEHDKLDKKDSPHFDKLKSKYLFTWESSSKKIADFVMNKYKKKFN